MSPSGGRSSEVHSDSMTDKDRISSPLSARAAEKRRAVEPDLGEDIQLPPSPTHPTQRRTSYANTVAGPSHLGPDASSSSRFDSWTGWRSWISDNIFQSDKSYVSGSKQHSYPNDKYKQQQGKGRDTHSTPSHHRPGSADAHADVISQDIVDPIQLQKEYDQEDQRLRSERSHLINVAANTFDCSTCRWTLPKKDAVSVHGCSHEFCMRCIEKDREPNAWWPIRCPICDPARYGKEPQRRHVPQIQQHQRPPTVLATGSHIQQIGSGSPDADIWQDLEPAVVSFSLDRKSNNHTQQDPRDTYDHGIWKNSKPAPTPVSLRQAHGETIDRQNDLTPRPTSRSTPARLLSGDEDKSVQDFSPILKLQQHFGEEDRRIQEDRKLIDTFYCSICMQAVLKQDAVRMNDCFHVLCKPCLDGDRSPGGVSPIRCPLCRMERSTADPTRKQIRFSKCGECH